MICSSMNYFTYTHDNIGSSMIFWHLSTNNEIQATSNDIQFYQIIIVYKHNVKFELSQTVDKLLIKFTKYPFIIRITHLTYHCYANCVFCLYKIQISCSRFKTVVQLKYKAYLNAAGFKFFLL